MAEIAKINLSGPIYDPRGSVPREDISDKIRRGKQDALNTAIKQMQMRGMQYKLDEAESLKKTDQFLAKNASKYFNTKADPLDQSTWVFTKPGAREDMYKDWQENVGGNWQGFQRAYSSAKQAESLAMQTRLKAMRHQIGADGKPLYRTDGEFQRKFSEQLDALPPDVRNQLLTQASPELYSQIQSTYLSPDAQSWEIQDMYDKLVSGGWMERETAEKVGGWGPAGVVGIPIAAYAAFRKGRFAKAVQLLKRGGKGGGGGAKEVVEETSPNAIAKRIKDARKQRKKMGIGEFTKKPKAKAKDKSAPKKDDWRARVKGKPMAGRIGRRPVGRGFGARGRGASIPNNKVPLVKKDIDLKVKTGQMSQKEGAAVKNAIDKQAKKGGNINPNQLQMDLVNDKTVDGAGIFKKMPAIIGFGGMGIGAGMLEDTEGLMNKYEMNMTEGEKTNDLQSAAEEAGLSVAGAAAPGMAAGLYGVYKKKGVSWMMKKVVEKGGPGLVARTLGKAALTGMSGPIGILMAGWAAKDLYDVYQILTESS